MFYNKTYTFYLVIAFLLLSVLFTTPFLRYPFDIFHHLIVIDELYMKITYPMQKIVGLWVNDIYIMIPSQEYESIVLSQPRYLWHYGWAQLFNVLQIDSSQLFLRAKIIHVIQLYISLFSIYYFSNVVLRNIFRTINTAMLQWLSFWATLIWLSIYATFSVVQHQVWIVWYSVNYQITLPFFWYILGLTLVLFFEEISWKKKFFLAFQILLISRFILQVHSMEFMYYLMHASILSLLFIDKVYALFKKYFYVIIPIIFGLGYIAMQYRPAQSPIFNYLSLEKLPELYEKIMQEGAQLLNGYNRASASINELMYLSVILGFLFLFYSFYQNYYRNIKTHTNLRMFIFIILTSSFVLIPLYQFTGGLFAMTTYTMVVNRIYYSASLFMLLPIAVYGILSLYKRTSLTINILMLALIVFTGLFSKYNDGLHHNYYRNLVSIKNIFNERKVGFNLSKTDIDIIKAHLGTYEKETSQSQSIRYYARADIAFVLKYLLKKEVYWEGRRAHPDYIKIYNSQKNNNNFYHILFEVPQNFTPYHPYR